MSRNLQFLLLLTSVVVVGVISGVIDATTGPSEKANLRLFDSLRPRRQPTAMRSWRPLHFARALIIGEGANFTLARPSVVKTDLAGNIYVLDVQTRSVMKFDPTGKLLLTFGRGKGRAPGYFEFPSDFCVAQNGDVWITDASTDSLSIFDSRGSLSRVIRLQGGPFRILEHQSGGLLVMLVHGTDHLFQLYSSSGALRRSFGTVLANQASNSVALEGWMANNGNGGLFYAAYRFGLIESFDPEGRPGFTVQPIRPVPLPGMDVARNGIRRVSRSDKVFAASAGYANGEIYVATSELGQKGYCDVIDFYDAKSGMYRGSVKLPERCLSAFWDGRDLYTLIGGAVTKWSIQDQIYKRGLANQKTQLEDSHG